MAGDKAGIPAIAAAAKGVGCGRVRVRIEDSPRAQPLRTAVATGQLCLAIRRQLLDTEADLVRANAGLAEVNARLKDLLAVCDLAPNEWLWPAVEVRVTFDPVDLDAGFRLACQSEPRAAELWVDFDA